MRDLFDCNKWIVVNFGSYFRLHWFYDTEAAIFGYKLFFFSLVFCVLFANSSYEMFSDSSLAVIAAAANQLKYLFSFAPLCILMCIHTMCMCSMYDWDIETVYGEKAIRYPVELMRAHISTFYWHYVQSISYWVACMGSHMTGMFTLAHTHLTQYTQP